MTVLAGGVGGSRFVRGVRAAWPDAQITVIGNTADDITMHGLRICPDLDTMMYALGDGIDDVKGWGRADEGWLIAEEMKAYRMEPTWFGLGDRDVATHLVRNQLITAGYSATEITAALSQRWLADTPITLLPMTDQRVETHVVIADEQSPSGQRAIHFQEFWVRLHAEPVVRQVLHVGIEQAHATTAVTEAIGGADLVLIAPSNPVVSIGPILATHGVRAALRSTAAPVIGFSPILGGSPVLGMADKLLPAIGVDVDAAAVGLHYGTRTRTDQTRGDGQLSGTFTAGKGILDAWVMHVSDAGSVDAVGSSGLPATAVPLLMSTPEHTAAFISAGVALVGRR